MELDHEQCGSCAMQDDQMILQKDGLRFGALGEGWVHVCVDMQRMFAEPTAWQAAWMPRVLPPHEHKVRAIPTLPTPEDLVAVWAPDLVRLVPVPRRHMQGLAETAWAKIAVGLGCCPLTAQGI